MPTYTIRVSDGTQQDRTINANDEGEATKVALTAMSVHLSTTFPPPPNIEITIMDEDRKARAMLRFGYEVADGEAGARRIQ